MIIIAVNGRQATLASRGELIQGNVDTIEAEFRIADGGAAAIWEGAVITAVFKIITPLGESKYAAAVVNRQSGIAKIPRIPMAYGNAKLKAGLRGVFEDESVVATNMVDVGTVIEGAGGRDYDCAMGDIWKDGTVLDDFLAEIAKLTHTHLNKAALDEVTADLIADVADNTASRHTHSNKATLDSLYYYDAEYPPSDNDPDDPIQMPSIDPDTSGRYLRAGDKYLRKTEDGGVIARVITITKSGKKYLRFTFNWDPDLFLDLEAGRSVAGRPMYVDIPVEAVNSQQGGNTLELDLGVNSINEEIIGIQEDLSVLPDWDENDTTKRSYIQNRTHWAETGTVFTDHTVEWLGTTPTYQAQPWAADDLGITLNEGETYTLQAAGATITCVCQKMTMTDQGLTQDYYFIGNLHIYDPSAEDNGFPMLLAVDNMWQSGEIIRTWNIVLTSDTLFGSDLSFRLGKAATVYHPLPPDYMPDDVKDAVEKKHTHENQAVLDDVTAQTLTDVAANTAARHSHSNQQLLNQIGVAAEFNGTVPMAFSYNNVALDGYSRSSFSGANASIKLAANTLHSHAPGFNNQTGELVYLESLEITGFQNQANIRAPEYFVEFTTGATAPTVTFPASVVFDRELKLEPNKRYQISILNDIALWCAVDWR